MTPDPLASGFDRDSQQARERELQELFALYMDRLNRGEAIDADSIIEEYPEVGPELLECLEGFVEAGSDGEGLERGRGTIGDYTLRRQIGRGGMGVVYDAWQNSLDRRVALKVLPAGVAADGKAFLRFMREAKTAAQLHHPNVVAVYGMGVEQNTPYYAMEFVEGETLAQVQTTIQEAVPGAETPFGPKDQTEYFAKIARAFADVADGLQHAHSRGIIHRDIKPSNLILDRGRCPRAGGADTRAGAADTRAGAAGAVAAGDATGVVDTRRATNTPRAAHTARAADAPGAADTEGSFHGRLRILDFGLARLEGQESLTGTGDFLGTLLYMSPEQAQRKKIPVDHRTDIYSLGATLYELLAGRPPFQGKDGQDTLSQIISKDPAAPRAFNQQMPRDLETIVLKCLRKSPQDRYATAEAIAQDLRRFARGDPIEARPQPAWEKWAHRLWRHRAVAVTIAALVVIALVGFAASSVLIWQEQLRTQRALERAAAEGARADRNLVKARENFAKAREAVDEMLTQVSQSWLASVPGMEEVRRSLLGKALAFYTGFLAEEGDDPEVRREAGRAQLRMGDILAMMGRHSEGEAAYRSAVAASGALAAEQPDIPVYRHDLARAHAGLAGLLSTTGRHEEAKKSAGESRDILASLAEQNPGEKVYVEDLASAEHRMGGLHKHEGQNDEAKRAYTRALDIRARLLAESPSSTSLLMAQAMGFADLSVLLGMIGAFEEAEEALKRARELAEKIQGEARSSSDCMGLFTRIRVEEGGEENLRQALALQKKLAEDFPRVPDHRKRVAGICMLLATALSFTDRHAETQAAYRESIDILRKLVEEFPGVPDYKENLARSFTNYSMWLRDAGQAAEALTACREAVRWNGEVVRDQPESPGRMKGLAMSRSNLAFMLMLQGEEAEAEKEFEAVRGVLRKLRDDHPEVHEYPVNLAMVDVNLGHLLEHQKRHGEAEDLLREAVKLMEATTLAGHAFIPSPREVLRKAHHSLAGVLAAAGRPAAAEESFQRAVSIQEEIVRDAEGSALSRTELAVLVENWMDSRLSAGMAREAAEIWPRALEARTWLAEQSPADVSHPLALAQGHERMAGALRNLGEDSRAEDEARQAEESYRKALAIAPENAGILNRFSRFLHARAASDPARREEDPSGPAATEAARLAAKAVETAPENAAFWNTLGVATYRSGEWKKSVEALEKSLELSDAGGPGEWLLLGMACWRLGKKQEAIRWHEKALDAIDEGSGGVPTEVLKLREEAEALYGSRELEAQRLVEAGDLARAEEALRDVVLFWEKLAEEDSEAKARSRHLRFAYVNLGQVLKAAGRPAEAEEAYRKALALAPDDPDASKFLAWVLAAASAQTPEKIAEAIRLAAKAAEVSPDDSRVWRALGVARYRSEDWPQAIAALEKSVKLKGGGGPVEWLFLSMASWKLGKKDPARKWYDKAVEEIEKQKTDGQEISSELQGFHKEAEALLGAEGRTR